MPSVLAAERYWCQVNFKLRIFEPSPIGLKLGFDLLLFQIGKRSELARQSGIAFAYTKNSVTIIV